MSASSHRRHTTPVAETPPLPPSFASHLTNNKYRAASAASAPYQCTHTQQSWRPMLRTEDQALRQRAQKVRTRINFHELTDMSRRCDWQWRKSRNGLSVFQRANPSTIKSLELLVMGKVDCTTEEMLALLRGDTDISHDLSMKRLYMRKFIGGSVVHTIPTATSETTGTIEELMIKSARFTRSSIFARNELWCYLEQLRRNPRKDNGFTLTQSTMDSRDFAGNQVIDEREDQLYGVTLACSVQPVQDSPNSLQFVFYCHFNGKIKPTDNQLNSHAYSRAIKVRLLDIANTMTLLPELLSRHRLNTQILAGPKTLEAKNGRCICCTKNLRFLTRKKCCYRCRLNVCNRCWMIYEAEGSIEKSAVICLQCVDIANISDRPSDEDSEEIEPQPSDKRKHDHVAPSTGTHIQHSNQLVDYLEEMMLLPCPDKRTAAITVMQQLLSEDNQAPQPLHPHRTEMRYQSHAVDDRGHTVENYLPHNDPYLPNKCVVSASLEHMNLDECDTVRLTQTVSPQSVAMSLGNLDELDVLFEPEVIQVTDEQTPSAVSPANYQTIKAADNLLMAEPVQFHNFDIVNDNTVIKFSSEFPIQMEDGCVFNSINSNSGGLTRNKRSVSEGVPQMRREFIRRTSYVVL